VFSGVAHYFLFPPFISVAQEFTYTSYVEKRKRRRGEARDGKTRETRRDEKN
jgi:hypothetical protein